MATNIIRLILGIFSLFIFPAFGADLWVPTGVSISDDGKVKVAKPDPRYLLPGVDTKSWDYDVKSSLSPTISGILTKSRRIYTILNPGQTPKIEETQDEEGINLEATNVQSGYEVTDYFKKGLVFQLGGGGGLSLFGSLGLNVQTLLKYSEGTYVVRHASTLNEALNLLPNPRFPTNSEEIKDFWKYPKDSISTTKTADLVVRANVRTGTMLLSPGIGISLQGKWKVLIERPNDSNSFDAKIKLAFENQGTIIAESSLSGFLIFAFGGKTIQKSWSKISGFSFSFDLDSKYVHKEPIKLNFFDKIRTAEKTAMVENLTPQKAYLYALAGILTPAQELAKEKNSGVMELEHVKKKEIAVTKSTWLSVPLLFNPFSSKEKKYVFSQAQKISDNELVIETSGVYTRNYFSEGILSKDVENTIVFKTTYQMISSLNEVISRGVAANLFYSYAQGHARVKDINFQMKKLAYMFGFSKLLKRDVKLDPSSQLIALPTRGFYDFTQNWKSKILNIGAKGEDKLGNIKIDLNVNFSNAAMDELISLPQKITQDEFLQLGKKEVEIFFQGEIEDFCFGDLSSKKNKINKELSLIVNGPKEGEVCKRIYTDETIDRLKDIYKTLVQVGQILKTDENLLAQNMKPTKAVKKFASKLSSLGKDLLKNRFIFKTIYRFLRFQNEEPKTIVLTAPSEEKKVVPLPITASLEIKGSNFQPYQIDILKLDH